jgi:hypothetical protein
MSRPPHDLIVLAADKDAVMALRGILIHRLKSLGIPSLDVQFLVHPERDPGCLQDADAYLRNYIASHSFALVVFDREGCGREQSSRVELEDQVELQLTHNGWKDRCAAIAIDPELEAWVWSDSPHVDDQLGWSGKHPKLRAWLEDRKFLGEGDLKPPRPKEAVEAALRAVKRERSSSIYEDLARNVGLDRCTDPAFAKLRGKLVEWFPSEPPE